MALEVQLGHSIPANDPHAVSVSLPTWRSNVGYEEGNPEIVSRMQCGYPRFFIHPTIKSLARAICPLDKQCLLLPSYRTAVDCWNFLVDEDKADPSSRQILALVGCNDVPLEEPDPLIVLFAICFDSSHERSAKLYWQHTGEGLSSRRAARCHALLREGAMHVVPVQNEATALQIERGSPLISPNVVEHGPGHESTTSSVGTPDIMSAGGFSSVPSNIAPLGPTHIHVSDVRKAKGILRKRIAAAINTRSSTEGEPEYGLSEELEHTRAVSKDDVYLFPTGMSSIYNTHKALLRVSEALQTVCFGFPYVDTLKILEKWGPGCLFYGHGSEEDLNNLEQRLARGERFQALFCEFPGNPLLRSPNLKRIRLLADCYGFAVVVDETLGNFLNVDVVQDADVIVSSLTKVFSGDCNVMGGSLVLNPRGRQYAELRADLKKNHEDNYWGEDPICMERNSRNYSNRNQRISANAEKIVEQLVKHPSVKAVFYPSLSETRKYYDNYRKQGAGYGGLLSVTFNSTRDAEVFYDKLNIAKGPSLGTNFSLCSPYTLLAHYNELEWAAQFGVDVNLVRISVGLEDAAELRAKIQSALQAIE